MLRIHIFLKVFAELFGGSDKSRPRVLAEDVDPYGVGVKTP